MATSTEEAADILSRSLHTHIYVYILGLVSRNFESHAQYGCEIRKDAKKKRKRKKRHTSVDA